MSICFEKIVDINNNEKCYPNDSKLLILATVDKKCFLYALCTDKNFSSPEIIPITKKDYNKFKTKYPDILEMSFNSESEMKFLINFAQCKSYTDTLTLEEYLELNEIKIKERK